MRSLLGNIGPARICIVVLWLLLIACVSSIYAQPTVPVRELLPADAQTSNTFANIFSVRQLAGGKVLLNDGVRRQLVVLDNKLTNPVILIDSIAVGSVQGYGARAAPMIPHLADSTLFVDQASRTLVLIDPNGKINRVLAAPKSSDFGLLLSGSSGVDAKGNLIYRGFYAPPRQLAGAQGAPRVLPDSAPLLRGNFETRVVDTIVTIKIVPSFSIQESKNAEGRTIYKYTDNPFRTVDNWVVLSNGTIALVRGHDYHVDFIAPDEKLVSTPKLPFDFRRLTDDDKQRFVDSAGTKNRQVYDSMMKAAALAGNRDPLIVATEYVPISQMADYYPSIRAEATKADVDGNLWILPTTSAQSTSGELIYDVVNNRGVLVERVRVPSGRSIAGFGRGGVVYLMSKNSAGVWALERTKRAPQK